MAGFQYKVVPFVGQVKTGFFSQEGPHTASKQLEDVINSYVTQGWEFCQLGHIDILVRPGCIAGLLGAKASTVVYDQVIFRRQS